MELRVVTNTLVFEQQRGNAKVRCVGEVSELAVHSDNLSVMKTIGEWFSRVYRESNPLRTVFCYFGSVAGQNNLTAQQVHIHNHTHHIPPHHHHTTTPNTPP